MRQFAIASAVFVLSICSLAVADEDNSTSRPSADKSQFTLLNPVPSNLMRDMNVDRPDKTDSPFTIDAGHLQLETGIFDYNFFRDKYQGDNAREESLGFGDFDCRVGVLNDLELDVDISAWDFDRFTDYNANQSSRPNGFGDTVIGGKLNFWGDDGSDDTWDTAFSMQPLFKIPTAREPIGDGRGEFFLGFPFAINLPAGFGLTAETTPSVERNLNNTGDVAGWQNSVSVDRVFFQKLDVYLEYWSHVSSEAHLEAQQTLDVGATFQATHNCALDTGVNFGLNHASETIEWTAGVSVRI